MNIRHALALGVAWPAVRLAFGPIGVAGQVPVDGVPAAVASEAAASPSSQPGVPL